MATLTSIAPTSVDCRGGETLTLMGTFPKNKALTVTVGGVAAYSALFGTPQSSDGVTVTVSVPPGLAGGDHTVDVDDGVAAASLPDALRVIERNWPSKVFSSRVCHPPFLGVGRRRLADEPLAQCAAPVFEPSTSFTETPLQKAWAPHRCGNAAGGTWSTNTITHLGAGGGWRIETPATFAGHDTPDTPSTWEGIAAAGWGYGAADFDIACSIENWVPANTPAPAVGFAIRKAHTPSILRPEGRIQIFVGLQRNSFAPNHSWVFWWFDPYPGTSGVLNYVAEIDAGSAVTGADLRLVRVGDDVSAYYNVGGGWQLIGTLDVSAATILDEAQFWQPMISGGSSGGSGVDNASQWDIKAFTHNSGTIIPPADEGIDDDHEDGIVLPAPYYTIWGTAFGPLSAHVVTESGGYTQVYNPGANNAWTCLHTRTIYPGDFSLQVDLEVVCASDGAAWAEYRLFDIHSDDRARYLTMLVTQSGGQKVAQLYRNIGAGDVLVGTSAALPSGRVTLRLERVGAVYSLYDGVTLIAAWADAGAEFPGPLTPAPYTYLFSSAGAIAARWYDVALLSGDDTLV